MTLIPGETYTLTYMKECRFEIKLIRINKKEKPFVYTWMLNSKEFQNTQKDVDKWIKFGEIV